MHVIPDLSILTRFAHSQIRDLLKKDQNIRLEVKERPDTGVYVKDLSEFTVHNADDMDRMMTYGNKNRKFSTAFLLGMH